MRHIADHVKALVNTAAKGYKWAVVVSDTAKANEMISLVPWFTQGRGSKLNRATLTVEVGAGSIKFVPSTTAVERLKGLEFDELFVDECAEINPDMLGKLENIWHLVKKGD